MGNKSENFGFVNFVKRSRSRKETAGSMTQIDDRDSTGERNSEYSTAVLAVAFAINSLQEQAAAKSGEKSSRSSMFRSTSMAMLDAPEKVERHEKLKSVLSWANEKKRKAKHKLEKTKSELVERKVSKGSALSKKD